ncbi:MAG: hypothetical protein PHN88_08920 [Ignavibacteria bacterium]|nr:hypothetical protein [Ignavibacteria bacterium]
MFKWDKISWYASVIFIIGLVLGAINNAFLGLLVVAYLLRPTILAFGGGNKYADERQKTIQFQSGNIALTIVIVAMIVFSLIDVFQGKRGDQYNNILIIALLAKAVVGLIMLRDYKTAGFRSGFFFGLLITLFILFDSNFQPIGFLIALPGIALMAVSYFGLRKPMIAAIVFGVIGITAGIFRTIASFRNSIPLQNEITTIVLVSVPLIVTSFFFYKGAKTEIDAEPEPE